MEYKDPFDEIIQQDPNVIYHFIEIVPRYQRLGDEIAYTLEKSLKENRIEYASLTTRTKDIRSFCHKVLQKNYSDPFNEIFDIAGVRVVYLYKSDFQFIEDIIKGEFEVIQKVDKVEDVSENYFGYSAVHFLVKLSTKSKGARYDELKDLVCEIQVRTILQDAWANVAHHLSYKQEKDVPKTLMRKLNSLVGVFETADDQFNNLRDERYAYREDISGQIKSERDGVLEQDINLDNLIAYLEFRFPHREGGQEDILLLELKKARYKIIRDLQEALEKASVALETFEEEEPPTDIETQMSARYTRVGAVRVSLKFVDRFFRALYDKTDMYDKLIRKYKDLFLSKSNIKKS